MKTSASPWRRRCDFMSVFWVKTTYDDRAATSAARLCRGGQSRLVPGARRRQLPAGCAVSLEQPLVGHCSSKYHVPQRHQPSVDETQNAMVAAARQKMKDARELRRSPAHRPQQRIGATRQDSAHGGPEQGSSFVQLTKRSGSGLTAM
jgi:hypothetical protein